MEIDRDRGSSGGNNLLNGFFELNGRERVRRKVGKERDKRCIDKNDSQSAVAFIFRPPLTVWLQVHYGSTGTWEELLYCLSATWAGKSHPQ